MKTPLGKAVIQPATPAVSPGTQTGPSMVAKSDFRTIDIAPFSGKASKPENGLFLSIYSCKMGQMGTRAAHILKSPGATAQGPQWVVEVTEASTYHTGLLEASTHSLTQSSDQPSLPSPSLLPGERG